MVVGNHHRWWHGRLGPHRRWIVANAVLGTALVNVAVNAGIAWLSVRGQQTVPLWPVPSLGRPSTLTDTMGTLFLLPLTTCLLCTTAVWRELRSGRLSPLSGSARVLGLGCALARLPARSRLRRGLVLGALSVLLLGPPVMLLLVGLHVGDLSRQAFVVYKVGFAVGLGALVTPVIALRAMADDLRAPA